MQTVLYSCLHCKATQLTYLAPKNAVAITVLYAKVTGGNRLGSHVLL